jgi:PEP-CTERM motif
MKSTIILSMSLSLGFAVAPSAHASMTFAYTTGNLGEGSGDNSIVETVSGETLTATAWSVTGTGNTTFQTATLGQYSGLGLGVCNQEELAAQGGCTAPQHEVDDNGQFDFVLFQFSSAVMSVTVTIDPVCDCNTDASYYVGNGLNPLGKTLAQLGTATTSNETTADTTRTVTLTGLGGGVTSVLFGASILGNDNYFKIESLSVTEPTTSISTTPEPATFGLAGIALIGLGVMARKR